jgi:hypothetical protein
MMKHLVRAFLIVGFFWFPSSELQCQEPVSASFVRVSGAVSAFKNDGWILSERFSDDLWSPAVSAKVRVYFLNRFFGELAGTHAWTFRHQYDRGVPNFS